MRDGEERKILRQAIRHYGEGRQVLKCLEELGELVQAISKMVGEAGATPEHLEWVGEEMADVEIMLEQLRLMLPTVAEYETRWRERKLLRLMARMDMEDAGSGDGEEKKRGG